MRATKTPTEIAPTTGHQAVIPFYAYAALCLLAATVLVFFSSDELMGHHFQPKIIALTHLVALGWGTMIILGASHQLIPVLIETALHSTKLAIATFVFAAAGIPLLVYGFLVFDLSFFVILGGSLINLSIIFYVINLLLSFTRKPKTDIHAMFIFTASVWLLLTTLLGLLLAINFTQQILSQDSLHFLTLHAHIGIAGWFLLLVTGVGSKLIPMFLISKYENRKLLYAVYFLINAAIIVFIVQFQFNNGEGYMLPAFLITLSIILFGFYCFRCY
ncbi:MAG: cytochrome C oxidase subunit I, partial [Chitinophagaceae bacterium]